LKKVVVLDTSFLLNSASGKRDLEAAIEGLVGPFRGEVPSAVIEELKALPKARGRPALALSSAFSILPCPGRGRYADACILKLTFRKDWVLATDDLRLSRAVRRKGIPVISHGGRGKLRFSPGSQPVGEPTG